MCSNTFVLYTSMVAVLSKVLHCKDCVLIVVGMWHCSTFMSPHMTCDTLSFEPESRTVLRKMRLASKFSFSLNFAFGFQC